MTGVFAHWPNRITAMRFVGAFVLDRLNQNHPAATKKRGFYIFIYGPILNIHRQAHHRWW